MKYQDSAEPLQADDWADGGAVGLADANINPATGLATDYLNHFNEAIMLLEMLSNCPDCRDDFLGWRRIGYRERFRASRFKGRAIAIAALLRPLVARAGSVINGEDTANTGEPATPQAVVDRLMKK